jgi:integrase
VAGRRPCGSGDRWVALSPLTFAVAPEESVRAVETKISSVTIEHLFVARFNDMARSTSRRAWPGPSLGSIRPGCYTSATESSSATHCAIGCLERLLAVASRRDRLIIALLLDTGLRLSELAGLRIGDLLPDGYLRV